MLRVEVRLGAVRARELSVRILHGRHLTLAVDLTDGSTAGGARENTPTALASDDMRGLLALLKGALLHHGAAVRHDAGLVHDAGHGTQDGSAAAAGRSGRDRLRVGHRLGRLGHAEGVGRWVWRWA